MRILIKDSKVPLFQSGKFNVVDSSILINGNKIEKIGDINETVDEVIDGKNKLVIPGLINTHSHASMSLFRNYKDDVNLQDWLFNYIFPVEDKLADGMCYSLSMLSILEMIRSGITYFADMYFFMEETAKAVIESGIRANLSRSVSGTNDFTRDSDYRLQESIKLFKEYNNLADGRIKVSIAPHSIYTCESEYLRECGKIARELNADLQIHMSETLSEVENCKKDHNGMTPFEYCESLDLFNQKGNIIAAHCVHLEDADFEIMKRRKINVAHNPTSNLKLASGIADVSRMMNEGINVTLGTDGVGSNNKLDILSEMRLATLIHKGNKLNPELVSAEDSFKMATINGAKAVGENLLGEIKEGNIADLVLVNIDKPHYYPLKNERLISALSYSGNSADVEDVIIDGKIVMKNNEVKTIDEEKVKFEVGRIEKCLI